MKIYKTFSLVALSMFITTVCILSCSNDLESFTEESQDFVNEKIEPYISAQMQEILSMLDTCSFTTPIPIEVLIPGLLNPEGIEDTDDYALSLETRSASGVNVVSGFSNYWTLYDQVPTTFTVAEAANLGLTSGAGTYTVTCAAASYNLLSDDVQELPLFV